MKSGWDFSRCKKCKLLKNEGCNGIPHESDCQFYKALPVDHDNGYLAYEYYAVNNIRHTEPRAEFAGREIREYVPETSHTLFDFNKKGTEVEEIIPAVVRKAGKLLLEGSREVYGVGYGTGHVVSARAHSFAVDYDAGRAEYAYCQIMKTVFFSEDDIGYVFDDLEAYLDYVEEVREETTDPVEIAGPESVVHAENSVATVNGATSVSFAELITGPEYLSMQLVRKGDYAKRLEDYRTAARYYGDALKDATQERAAFILPRISACFRKLKHPEWSVELLDRARSLYEDKYIDTAFLTSVAAAYCDMGLWADAEALCDEASFKCERPSMHLENVYERILYHLF